MKILMTDGTSNSARQTIYGLNPNWQIDICAPSPLAQCRFSSFVHRYFKCPPVGADPTGYLRFLLRRLRAEPYDVLLPTHEEVYLMSRFRNRFQEHAALAVPSLEAMRQMLGKIEFAETMRSLSLPTPDYVVLTSLEDLQRHDPFPYFLKRNYATAGLGVRRIAGPEDRAEAVAAFRRAEASGAESLRMVAQRPASGRMCVAQSVFQHGQLVAAHCAEVLEHGVGGSPLVRISVEHPIVIEHLRHLGQSLQWHGPLFLEYFYDAQKGAVEYIECNPRIGEPVNALLSGVDLVAAFVAVSQDEQRRSYGAFGRTKSGVRSHVGFVGLMGRAVDGATRRQIAEHRRMMARREGIYRQAENEMTRPGVDSLSRIPAAFVTSRLLVRPADVSKMVQTTVQQYALPHEAIEQIDQMDEGVFDESP